VVALHPKRSAVFGTDAEGAHHDEGSGWHTEVQSW